MARSVVRQGQKRRGDRPEEVFQSLRIKFTALGNRRTRSGAQMDQPQETGPARTSLVGDLGAANKLLAQRVAGVCQPLDDCCKQRDGDGETQHRQRDLRLFGNLVNGTDVISVKEDEALTLSIGYTSQSAHTCLLQC